MEDTGPQAPQSQGVVAAVVADHVLMFGRVLADAWAAFSETRDLAPPMAFASASSRGMLVSDFTREPAHRIFAPVSGVWVDDRYGRPWVNLAGGAVQVRFRKLTPDLELCRNDSDRATRLSFHLGDPALPEMEPATILTAGYVLDAADLAIERMALVCHLGREVHYVFRIPAVASADSSAGQPLSGMTSSPLIPLSAPIIRSAQAAATKRLADGRSVLGQAGGGEGDGA